MPDLTAYTAKISFQSGTKRVTILSKKKTILYTV